MYAERICAAGSGRSGPSHSLRTVAATTTCAKCAEELRAHLLEGEEHDHVPGAQAREVGHESPVEGKDTLWHEERGGQLRCPVRARVSWSRRCGERRVECTERATLCTRASSAKVLAKQLAIPVYLPALSPITRDLTTSTGDPAHTATNPAPRPERIWQTVPSSKAPDESSVCFT